MEPAVHQARLRIAIRAITVWLFLIVAEILHGIARGIFLVPHPVRSIRGRGLVGADGR